jgi:YhcH/YjgK/YiaL family protein
MARPYQPALKINKIHNPSCRLPSKEKAKDYIRIKISPPMIHAGIEQLHWYRILSPAFALAIDRILQTDFTGLPSGRYDWAGEHVYALVNEYSTQGTQACEPESHRLHADIQIMLEGEELMGYTPLRNQIPHRPFLPENDVAFYQIKPDELSYIRMKQGEFIIFFPGDIHQPEIMVNEPASVKKLVVKILL